MKNAPQSADQRPLSFAIVRRLIGYTAPHARLRNRLLLLVVLRALQLPVVTWAAASVISGPIARHDVQGTLAGVAGFLVLVAFTSWLVLARMPEAERRIEELREAAREATDFGGIQPGRFTPLDSGRTVLYAREVEGNQLTDVFIQGERDGRVFVVTAKRGERVAEGSDGSPAFLLYDGRRVEGEPGEAEFLVAEFGEHGSPIRIDAAEESVQSVASRPTRALLASSAAADRAELQWRLSTPLSLIVLALLAVPLSRASPREGRYARIGVGLLIYVIYVQMLFVARVSVERNGVPEWLGMWWVHALLGLGALLFVLRQSGMLSLPRPFAYDSRTRHEPAA